MEVKDWNKRSIKKNKKALKILNSKHIHQSNMNDALM